MNSDQIFRLIDGILPFEACLYYQVLPLSLEGSRLNLGMVDLEDSSALNYARRIFAYLNCSLVPQAISAEMHKSVLSAYLSYVGTSQKSQLQKKTPHQVKPESAPQLELEEKVESNPKTKGSSSSKATGMSLPTLEVHTYHLSSPVEVLATLPPQQLLRELLGRILVGGIGRLYFERQEVQGRILWSQNGVLQSVLEALPIDLFQGVINELKLLTQLPLIPIQNPKQVEIERCYQQSHLLLRLRLKPGNHGEEATLQVLRGAALKFYQQQQLENFSREALRHAQQLHRKLKEICDRTEMNPALNIGQLEALPALEQILTSINHQMEMLQSLPTNEKTNPK